MTRWLRHRRVSYHPLALELKPVAQCVGAVEDIIKSRIITSKTFLEAWLS
jgi:hypothetical protein